MTNEPIRRAVEPKMTALIEEVWERYEVDYLKSHLSACDRP